MDAYFRFEITQPEVDQLLTYVEEYSVHQKRMLASTFLNKFFSNQGQKTHPIQYKQQ